MWSTLLQVFRLWFWQLLLENVVTMGFLEHRPHNVPFVLLGAESSVVLDWFGFNAGSALAPNGLAVHALVTTHFSAAAAMFSWLALEKYVTGHPTLVGASTGLVARLVAITPYRAGFVSIWSSILIGPWLVRFVSMPFLS